MDERGAALPAAGADGAPDIRRSPVSTSAAYAPSHLNGVVDAIRRSSVPAPLIYAAIWILFVGIEMAVKVADGTIGDVRIIHVMLPTYAMLVLPSVHFFADDAARALTAARPLLTLSDAEVEAYRRALTVLPAGRTAIAAVAGLVALAVLTLIQPRDTFAVLGTMTSPLASAVEWTWQVLLWAGVGMTVFLIARQMAIVVRLTTRHTRIDLFALGPIYAYSRLTAAHAIFTAGVVVVASLALSRLAGTLQWNFLSAAALLMAGAAFVLPLWGAYRLIASEKRRQEDRLGRTIQRLMDQLRDRAEQSELNGVGDFKTALEGIVVSREQVRAISGWPWRPETLGGVLSALLAPLLIWLITRGLEAFLRA